MEETVCLGVDEEAHLQHWGREQSSFGFLEDFWFLVIFVFFGGRAFFWFFGGEFWFLDCFWLFWRFLVFGAFWLLGFFCFVLFLAFGFFLGLLGRLKVVCSFLRFSCTRPRFDFVLVFEASEMICLRVAQGLFMGF